MKGSELTLDWLRDNERAMSEPIVIEIPDGLGLEMPDSGITVKDAAQIVGEETPVEVMGAYNNTSSFTSTTI